MADMVRIADEYEARMGLISIGGLTGAHGREVRCISISHGFPEKDLEEKMAEWVLHCAVNQRHIRRTQPTKGAALKDACSNETISAKQVEEWCAKNWRPSA
jgi:hypothetical protein